MKFLKVIFGGIFMKHITMPLPILKRCCFCLPLETGCIILNIMSLMLYTAMIAVGSWQLPWHKQRRNEDNLILMSMVMFSTLSAISALVVLLGILRKRSGYLQLSLLSNSVFSLCLVLVAVVACLFSPALRPFLDSPGYVVLVIVIIFAGAAYSAYYLLVVKSQYTRMKMTWSESAIPV